MLDWVRARRDARRRRRGLHGHAGRRRHRHRRDRRGVHRRRARRARGRSSGWTSATASASTSSGAAATCARPAHGALVVVEPLGAGRIVSVGRTRRRSPTATSTRPTTRCWRRRSSPPDRARAAPSSARRRSSAAASETLVDLVGTPVAGRPRPARRRLPPRRAVAGPAPRATRRRDPARADRVVRAHRRPSARLLGRADRPGPGRRASCATAPAATCPVRSACRSTPAPTSWSTPSPAAPDLDDGQARRAAIDPVTSDDELVEVAALLTQIRKDTTHGRRPTHA